LNKTAATSIIVEWAFWSSRNNNGWQAVNICKKKFS